MATPNFAKKNPFMGMSVKDMKDHYDKKVRGKKLTLEQKRHLADQMQAARKAAPKAKSKPVQSKATTKSKMGADVLDMGGRNVRRVTKTGTHGQYRKKGDPGPAVRRAGSTTGASVDPRERSLRRNREEARRHSRRNLRINRRGRRS